MAFRPPSLRTPRPRSPVNRSTPWGKEVLVLLALAVAMVLMLVSIHSTSINTTIRMMLGFSETESATDSFEARLPAVCAHNGVDRSLTPSQEETLRTLGIRSIADRMALMCHLNFAHLSVPVPATFREEIRRMFHTRVCCMDFDVFFTSEGIAVVGRPALVAQRLAAYRSGNTSAVGTSDVEAIEEAIMQNKVSLSEIRESDPHRTVSQRLHDIALVVGKVISSEASRLHGHNATRVTLEPKLSDVAPPARSPMERSGIISAKEHRAEVKRTAGAPMYIGDAVQVLAYEVSHVTGFGVDSKGYALWEYFGVIIDPMRYANAWDRMMVPAGVVSSGELAGPEGFTVLVTEPQLWYVLSLKDVVLTSLTNDGKAVPAAASSSSVAVAPESYCAMLLEPPQWAREIAPSVGFQKRCVKWFDAEVTTSPSPRNGDGTKAVDTAVVSLTRKASTKKRGGAKKSVGGSSWLVASNTMPYHKHLITWVVDDISDYSKVVALGDRDGLRSAFVVSNTAQSLWRDVLFKYHR